MKDRIILDLCGGTGAWSKPYADAGYDVRVITLPEQDVRSYVPPNNVYGILAAPPCTMFSIARTRATKERDLEEGMELVKACLEIIWRSRYKPLYKKDGALTFWALENPRGILRQFLGKAGFTFDPCDFGERYTKKTDLWGYFNDPVKNPIDLNQGDLFLSRASNRKMPSVSDLTAGQYPERRALTPPGFAKAFFEANP